MKLNYGVIFTHDPSHLASQYQVDHNKLNYGVIFTHDPIHLPSQYRGWP
jgi:hypothetical protein